MSDLRDLQSARDALAAALDARAAAFQDALTIVWRRLDRALVTLVEEAAAGSTTAIIRAARAGRLKKAIETAFEDAGWPDLVDASTSTSLDAVLTDVSAVRLAAQIAEFNGPDLLKLEALKVLSATDVLGEGEFVASTLWKAVVNGVFSSRPPDQILEDLGTILDKSAPQLRTLYDTSISIFARQAEQLSVPVSADRPYVYTGPSDEKVRPFCREHLGKVYTKDAIDQMDNGQLPNCLITAGGFNCRHSWVAVSKFSELRPLANTGQRVPELSRGIEAGGRKAA